MTTFLIPLRNWINNPSKISLGFVQFSHLFTHLLIKQPLLMKQPLLKKSLKILKQLSKQSWI